jgi:nocardicin N-oxygenase
MGDVRKFPTTAIQSLDPDPLLVELLATEPVSRVQLPFGEPCWLVTRYDDVREMLGNPCFSRAATVDRDVARTQAVLPIANSILGMDAPDHTRIRRLVSATFTARRGAALRERAQEVVDGLLDDMERAGSPADLVEGLALPLPIAMISELLGVPFGDRHRFRRWADTFMTSSGYTIEEVTTSHAQLAEYLAGLVARRRDTPTDDLLGALVAARDVGDDRISEPELISLALAILVAGYETTASQLGKFVLCLFRNPEQLALLREQPALIPNAVEELLRLIPLSAGTSVAYLATDDVEIGGITIPAGDAVIASTAAANRDASVFADPARLDVTRPDISQLGFGHGPHFCLGAHLARLELQVAIATLLTRFPDLRLAVADHEVPWKDGSAVWGLQALPVAF